MTQAQHIAANKNFQFIAVTEAIDTLAKKRNVCAKGLMAEFVTMANESLTSTVAKMVAFAATQIK